MYEEQFKFYMSKPLKFIEGATGTLSNPSKMPSRGTSTPAYNCITGSKLVDIIGSVCEDCYARKGRYVMPNVDDAMMTRFDALGDPDWVPAMAALITKREKSGYFRWHDSGDVQGLWHIDNIMSVCKLTPEIDHWLPTKEQRMFRVWFKRGGILPDNMVVRYSAHMKDEAPDMLPGSMVTTTGEVPEGVDLCPAPSQDGECGNCRKCWDPTVDVSAYHVH